MDKHFIVLNGKRYDAVTGKLLGNHASVSTQSIAIQPPTARSHARVTAKSVHAPRTKITVASRSNSHPQQQAVAQTKPIQVAVEPKLHVAKPTSTRTVHSQHVAPHKPQTPKTLMRRVVQKPAINSLPVMKVQYPVLSTGTQMQMMAPKRLAHNIDDKRLSRAKRVPQSSNVGRFQAKNLQPITVKKQIQPSTVGSRAIAASVVSEKANSHVKPSQSIFEQALAEARSHEQTFQKKTPKRRTLAAVSGVAALFIIGGIILIANNARLETQLASVQAGFQVSTPEYVPAGFTKNETAVAGKAVQLNYVSGTDKSTYTLKQESSNWNSQTLFDHVYDQYGSSYQAVQHNGQTIYMYGENLASWVSGGILYEITGTADLTSDDILAIADSL